MGEPLKQVPEEIQAIWGNLSPQMQAHIKAFGVEPTPLTRADFSDEEWSQLSFQMRARIISRPSMDASGQLGE